MLDCELVVFFFFSSRRRHTRLQGDWSSDVCSSDLSFLALPPAFDSTRRYPLFVLIHGGAANMWRDAISLRWNYHLLAKPGYVMLMTNYTGSTGFGEEFAQSIQGDPLRGPAEEIIEA